MNTHLKKIAKRVLHSHRKTRIEFTRKIKGDKVYPGIAYYLDNYAILMKNTNDVHTVDDVFKVLWDSNMNTRPNGEAIPPQEDFIMKVHAQERSRERSIMADEIYETILFGLEMDMSNPKVTKKKYFKDDIAVVVAWEDTGVIITEMSLSPTRRKGFIDQIPILFEDLRNVGLKWGSLTVLDKTAYLYMLADREINQLIHHVTDAFKFGLQNHTKEQLEMIKPGIKIVSQLQKTHEVYDYNTVDGVLHRGEVNAGHMYQAAFLAPPLTDKQKKVLEKWGLSLKKASEGDIPSITFEPISKDKPVPNVEVYMFDMSQFSGNAHEWFFSKTSCKLSQL